MNEPHRSRPSKPTGAKATGDPPVALAVLPPREESGAEPLFRVVYMIDLNAPCPEEAVGAAYRIMSDPTSMPPVLEVVDHAGNTTTVDLSEAVVCGDAAAAKRSRRGLKKP